MLDCYDIADSSAKAYAKIQERSKKPKTEKANTKKQEI